MQVLLLNGSANKNGNTFTALSEIARQLEKSGVESEIMQLGGGAERPFDQGPAEHDPALADRGDRLRIDCLQTVG